MYNRDPVYSLLLTFGLLLHYPGYLPLHLGRVRLPLTVPASLSQGLSSDLFFITGYRVFMMAIVLVAVVGLFVFLRTTRMGVRIRAGTLDLDTVAALGINVGLLRSLNFAVGIYLAGLAGVLASGQIGAQPEHGRRPAAAGLHRDHRRRRRQPDRHAAGGLLIGVASAVTTVFLPSASEAVIYVIMALVLLIRPRGLMGEEGLMT
ncbi:MAG: branched-chain amino acid ABC transporter permease [Acetobacteraceae bacterium]